MGMVRKNSDTIQTGITMQHKFDAIPLIKSLSDQNAQLLSIQFLQKQQEM